MGVPVHTEQGTGFNGDLTLEDLRRFIESCDRRKLSPHTTFTVTTGGSHNIVRSISNDGRTPRRHS